MPGRVVGAAAPPVAKAGRGRAIAAAVLLLGLLTAAYVVFGVFGQRSSPQLEYLQLTNFTDSSTSPALSPDGRMLAFVRGESTFYGSGHIYAKLLPEGDAVQLTQEEAGRADPAFTPDGARITFSEGSRPENPFGAVLSVATLGGQPPRLVASSIIGMTTFELTPGQRRVLYSEFTGHGAQLAIVTASESRTDRRVIYMPPEPYGMAHRSAISPDRRHVLVSAEMNIANWLPCRVVPYDGGGAPRFVGPVPSQCTDAAWSPDGRWMYFTANTGRGFHVWRQPFPQGEVEQVTAGTTEEEGIDFAPDGRSFVTAIGSRQSTIWVHDARGDRQITSEGYGLLPTFSPDVTKLYYMRKTSAIGSWASASLWVADLRTGERQPVLPDVLRQTYDISRDGRRVVFASAGDTEDTPVWIAALDGSTPPRRLSASPAMSAFFGPHGDVFFQSREGAGAIYFVNEDGTNLRKRGGLADVVSFSADGRWIGKYSMPGAWVAQSMDGERTVRISRGSPLPGTFEAAPWPAGLSWTRDGRFMYVRPNNFATYALPLRPGAVVPDLPAAGFQSEQELAAFAGARLVARGPNVFPGPTPDVYAFTKVATQRNIYRVILR